MGDSKLHFTHRNSLRRLGALAGAKGVNAVVALLRGKLTAVLLGPEGMGVAALLTSTTSTVQQAAGLGLNLSGVKAIASGADATLTLRRLFLATSLLAALLTLSLATLLSEATFGNAEGAAAFRWLTPGVFFSALATGEFAILQGRREMSRVARASAIGAVVGLLPAIPLYYYMRMEGIVPALVAASLILWLSLRLTAGKSPAGARFDRQLARRLIVSGVTMMASLVAAAVVTWLTLVVIRRYGSVDMAGLFQSANSTVTRATEVVFAALSLDFFPALAAVALSTSRLNLAINRQTELVAMVATPLALVIILGAPLIIRLLLDSSFLSACSLMRWLALGALLKAISYPLGFIAFVKDNRRVFILLEVVGANLLELAIPLGMFIAGGRLEWFGIGYCAAQAATIALYYTVNRRLYRTGFTRRTFIYMALAALLPLIIIFALK